MATDAHCSRIVCFGVYARNTFSFTGRIGQIGMTAQTELTTAVNIQLFWFFRMIEYRTVTILTGNGAVKFFGTNFHDIAMALGTKFMQFFPTGRPVLSRLIGPFGFVGLAMVRVHETSAPGAEIIGNIEKAKYKHCYDENYDHI